MFTLQEAHVRAVMAERERQVHLGAQRTKRSWARPGTPHAQESGHWFRRVLLAGR